MYQVVTLKVNKLNNLHSGMDLALTLIYRMNSLKRMIEFYERKEILRALGECDWNKAKAARMPCITERMIGYKINTYGIGKEEKKAVRSKQ